MDASHRRLSSMNRCSRIHPRERNRQAADTSNQNLPCDESRAAIKGPEPGEGARGVSGEAGHPHSGGPT